MFTAPPARQEMLSQVKYTSTDLKKDKNTTHRHSRKTQDGDIITHSIYRGNGRRKYEDTRVEKICVESCYHDLRIQEWRKYEDTRVGGGGITLTQSDRITHTHTVHPHPPTHTHTHIYTHTHRRTCTLSKLSSELPPPQHRD